MTLTRWLFRIEGIHGVKTRNRSIKAPVVDNEMAITAHLHAFAAECDQPFHIELIIGDVKGFALSFGYAFGLKHDDFPALWTTKIVGQPVNKQMIAGKHFCFKDGVAFVVKMSRLHASVIEQEDIRWVFCEAPWRQSFRWRPNRVPVAAYFEPLAFYER